MGLGAHLAELMSRGDRNHRFATSSSRACVICITIQESHEEIMKHVHAVRKTGDEIWERCDLRVYQPVHQGSSPIVDHESVYVAYDGTDQQFFVALDKETGEDTMEESPQRSDGLGCDSA